MRLFNATLVGLQVPMIVDGLGHTSARGRPKTVAESETLDLARAGHQLLGDRGPGRAQDDVGEQRSQAREMLDAVAARGCRNARRKTRTAGRAGPGLEIRRRRSATWRAYVSVIGSPPSMLIVAAPSTPALTPPNLSVF
jgi:hypothetical protein